MSKMKTTARAAVALTMAILSVIVSAEEKSSVTLVDLAKAAPGVIIDLRYTRADNFFKKAFYPPDARALLRPTTAAKLAMVQEELKKEGLGLKIWDAYRPLAVQRAMWKVLPNPDYVADPAKGGRHNRAAAVDVTLVDAKGKELVMPTPHDEFSPRAGAHFKLIAPAAAKNRKRLQDAMVRHGFAIFESEWWHFDDADWQQHPALDLPLK